MNEIYEASELAMLMLDTSPVCAQIWDKTLRTIDCNNAAVKMYGFKDKNEYAQRFLKDCSPECQPDGKRSDEKALNYVTKAFEKGYCKFDWMHKMPDDHTLIPSEITLVRAKYRDNDVILGYTRDMREHFNMMETIKHRDRMLEAVNNAAVLLLTTDENEDIEVPMLKSMELVCRSADADRVFIWRNELIDNNLHYVCAYYWSDEKDIQNQVYADLKFPYSDKPYLESKFMRGEYINSQVSKMQNKEQLFFGGYDIKSVCMIPLFLDKQFWGFFSIDDCKNERDFSEDEIAILRSVSLMLASAINRHSLVAKRTYELALQTTTLTTLFDSIPDLIFTKNLDLDFTQCNKSLLEHFNKTYDDIIGKNDRESLEYSEEEVKAYEETNLKVINEGRTLVIEEHIPRFDGTNPLYETIKMPLILDSEVVGVMGIARDITKRKEMEAAALASSRSKSSFLANMSHEIRTPMNVILGVTELLIQHTTLPAEIEEGLGKIYSSCVMLLGIINDILDFSKIEAGKMDIMPAQYKTADMISDSMHLNMMHINSKPIEFELQIDENVPANLLGDEIRIKQILNNILSNAFKYTSAGKVTMSVTAKPSVKINEIILELKICDTGPGMKKEELDRLFDEYSRFNQEKNVTIEGTGLGLFITRQLVTLMNGEIHVQSEPGKGSVFTICLPQETIDTEVLGKETVSNFKDKQMSYFSRRKRGQIERSPMPYGSVLIVDDVETNLYVAVGLMKLYRLKIDTAQTGYEAIEKIKSGKVYDIIFMDHMMPEMDGMEAAMHIRNLGYTAPIVALTANALIGQAEIFLENGFDEFISKPIDIRQLDSILNKLIRDKQLPEVIEAAEKQKAEVNRLNIPQTDTYLHESFTRDARKAILWLEEQNKTAWFKEDNILRKFTIIVHGIKSSLWNIGETALAEFASNLEKNGRESDIDQITSSVPEFLKEMHKVLEKYESFQDEYSADEDIEDLQLKLLAIREMCAAYNRKGALDILSKIKKYSKETKIFIDKIKEYVLHSDFEEAETAVTEYAKNLLNKNTRDDVENTAEKDNKASSSLLNTEIKGLDIIKGLERFDGDEKIYLKLLRSYAISVSSMLDEIETVCEELFSSLTSPETEELSLSNYRVKVHGIKGTSFDIFAEQTGKDAANLENAAKTNDITFIKNNTKVFLDSSHKLVFDIEELLSKLEAENPKPKKDIPDNQTLLKLLTACRDYDLDEADEAMAEIEKYKYVSDGGLTDWLRDNIDRMDFTQIVQRLSDLDR
ncbi:MAG: ATP-binding protein [Treponema sp.]|nr:ATP-binding protein [Treponema sp.]